MKLKDIIEFSDKARDMNFDELESSYIETISDMGDYFNERGEEGKNIILNKMKEEDFVKLVRAAKATLLTTMTVQGMGKFLLLAEMADNDLDGFTHTMILNILGVLAEEEVI